MLSVYIAQVSITIIIVVVVVGGGGGGGGGCGGSQKNGLPPRMYAYKARPIVQIKLHKVMI